MLPSGGEYLSQYQHPLAQLIKISSNNILSILQDVVEKQILTKRRMSQFVHILLVTTDIYEQQIYISSVK